MRWSKIKNIIILLLIIVNLALLALVGVSSWRSREYERQARARMITILSNNGIAFLPDQVPDSLGLAPQRLTATEPERSHAELLVGPVSSVETVGARTVYTGETGQVTFSPAGDIQADFLPGAGPGEAGALTLLDRLDVEYAEESREAADGGEAITLIQRIDGVPIPNETVSLTFRGGALESLSLRRLAGTWETLSPAAGTITASTALMRFLEALNEKGYVCSQVSALYPGWSLSGAETVTFTPSWFIETDTQQRFVIDGVTGAVAPQD